MMNLHTQTLDIPAHVTKIALCGGPYSNFASVEEFLTATQHLPLRFCLGDLGGFGPEPNRTIEQLRDSQVICLQGNYDHAVGYEERDCGCGYSDPRDQRFAQLSYDYTYSHTAPQHREWMQTLPQLIRLRWRDRAILLCHGSPEQVNEFVWESEASDTQIENWLERYRVCGICATHSGIPWVREVSGGFWFNVGVLGRPAHEGLPHVYYGLLRFPESAPGPQPQLIPLTYEVDPVIAAMQREGLPEEFVESLHTGIWTTCAEILPESERVVRSRISRQPVPG